jgi:hypothetical protein
LKLAPHFQRRPQGAFAAAPMLDWLLKEKQITQHVSVLEHLRARGLPGPARGHD